MWVIIGVGVLVLWAVGAVYGVFAGFLRGFGCMGFFVIERDDSDDECMEGWWGLGCGLGGCGWLCGYLGM